MRNVWKTINAVAEGRPMGWFLLAAMVLLYAWGYAKHPLFPGHEFDAQPRGWWTWTDQSRYLEEATAIAGGNLSAKTYHYPIGYSALGALFVRWMPVNPFFVPDLLLVLAAVTALWRLARRWLSGIETMLVGVVFVVIHRELLGLTSVVPWNTIATQAALLSGVFITLTTRGQRAVVVLASLAALTYLVRPIDTLAFAPMLAYAALTGRSWRERAGSAAVALTILLLAVVAIGELNRSIFGTWKSPYENISMERIGFFSYPVSLKFFWLFVDGGPLFGENDPALLFRYPWLLGALPAAAFLLRRERWAGAAVLAGLILNVLLYVNYNDLLPSDLYRFTLIHYLTWWFPLLFGGVVAAYRHGWQTRAVQLATVASVALFILSMGLRLEPETALAAPVSDGTYVLPKTRPLLIHFVGAPIEAVGDLRVDGQPLIEYSQYVVPYVPSDLRLLLGVRTRGDRLSLAPTSKVSVQPEIGTYVWRWRWTRERLRAGRW